MEENDRQSQWNKGSMVRVTSLDNVMRVAPADTIMQKVKQLNFNIDNGPPLHPPKNVFKITKIDLVLKSDNYGQTELFKS